MIIILTQCYPPRVGGIENLVFNLSYHLSKFEKVVVLADQHNPISEIIFDKRFTQNLIIKRFGGFKFFRKRNKVRELKNIIKLKKVTAIIGDSWKSLEIAIQKIDNKKTPFLSLVHGNEIIIKNQKHHKRLLNTFSKVEKIICNSQFTKDLLKKINIKFNEVAVNLEKEISLDIENKILDKLNSLSEIDADRRDEQLEKIKIIISNLKPYYKEVIKIDD